MSARRVRSEAPGLAMLAVAVLFTAYFCAPELRIGRVPLNDVTFHLAASERMAESFSRGEPFLDPWVSEWSLGYPVWLSYQPLPHLAAAGVLKVFHAASDPAGIFAAWFYVLMLSFPASAYLGARLLGLTPAGAGMAALLVFAPSAGGLPGSYGLSYGSITWRGSGLYTQLFALHLMVIGIGMTARALDRGGRKTRIAASLLLALTALSHIIFGYAAFVSAAVLAVCGQRGRRSNRLVRLAAIAVPAAALLAWFVVPLALRADVVNHSRWEDPRKWDSYGAGFILRELLSGRLLDFGRLPWLSVLLGVGALRVAFLWRSNETARRLIGLTVVWLMLFFGRETWGHLMLLAGIPADFHIHRLQAVFELSAILLGCFGLMEMLRGGSLRNRFAALTAAAAITAIGVDRAAYLDQNRVWGEQNLTAYAQEAPDLQAALTDVRTILAARPGRVSAGPAAGWGGQFKIGSVPVYAFLTREHLEQASFLYHSMSKASDVMVLRNENVAAHDVAFGIRAVVAPANQSMPPHLRRRGVHGRFAVYESSSEGYFGVVDVSGNYTGPRSTLFEPESAWLSSSLPASGSVVSLDPRLHSEPAIERWGALPDPPAEHYGLRGAVLRETRSGERYQASIEVNRPAYALVKINWHPDLAATVDGRPAPLLQVTPGFGAVPLPGGTHEVAVSYQPGSVKPILLAVGLVACLCWWLYTGPSAAVVQTAARIGHTWDTPRVRTTAALVLIWMVAVHPLFRGKLVEGHDATEYPPRVIEMERVLADGQFPPLWAPDLGAGHGQPLFEFAPPLLYWAAMPFRALRLGLTDSIQFALAALFLIGAAAVYRIGRWWGASRLPATAGAAIWLFAPYVSLDLFVRAAFAEASALAIVPAALLALLRAVERRTAGRIAAAAVLTSLIPLGHNVAALVMIPAMSVAAIGLALAAGDKKAGALAAGGAVIIGGLGLSAFFWFPALREIQYLHGTRLLEGSFDWREHILSPLQLLWSAWGYGLSVAGTQDGISFQLGPAHLVLAALGVVAARRRRALAASFGAMVLLAAWLSTDWSHWVWSHAPLLRYVQHPWRLHMLAATLMPLLAVPALDRGKRAWVAAALAVAVGINLPHTEPRGYLTYDDEYYAPASIASRGINTTTHEEYEPRWAQQRPAYSPALLTAGLAPGVKIQEIARRTALQEFVVEVPGETTVISSAFYYPGWQLSVDGRPVPVAPAALWGTMQFQVPAGVHRVKLALGSTPVRRNAALVSLATLLVLGMAVVGSATISKCRSQPQMSRRFSCNGARETGTLSTA